MCAIGSSSRWKIMHLVGAHYCIILLMKFKIAKTYDKNRHTVISFRQVLAFGLALYWDRCKYVIRFPYTFIKARVHLHWIRMLTIISKYNALFIYLKVLNNVVMSYISNPLFFRFRLLIKQPVHCIIITG